MSARALEKFGGSCISLDEVQTPRRDVEEFLKSPFKFGKILTELKKTHGVLNRSLKALVGPQEVSKIFKECRTSLDNLIKSQ